MPDLNDKSELYRDIRGWITLLVYLAMVEKKVDLLSISKIDEWKQVDETCRRIECLLTK